MADRLKSIDRETLKSTLASRTDLSEEDVEHILNQIESTRDKVVGKAEEMKAEVERRMNRLKEAALKQAEETRLGFLHFAGDGKEYPSSGSGGDNDGLPFTGISITFQSRRSPCNFRVNTNG